jgi:hypothetical protein
VNNKRKKCEIPKTVCNLRDEDGYCSLGYECQPVIDRCLEGESCERIENGYCKVYIFPEAKWRSGNCPMATHLKKKELSRKEQMKTRIGQQKQIKR